MEHTKAEVLQQGGQSIYIHADPNAAGFYQAIGGVLTGNKESASIPGRFLPIYIINL